MAPAPPSIPLAYAIFFLWIEPVATLAGGVYAALQPAVFLALIHPAGAAAVAPPASLPVATLVAMQQLGNMLLAFALIEALVLRAAAHNLAVCRTLLAVFLLADAGHLLSLYPLGGLAGYYDVRRWNSMAYGSYLFVYVGAAFRIAFLLGLGFPSRAKRGRRAAAAATTTTTTTSTTPAAKKSTRAAIAARQDELLATPTPTPAQLSKTPAQSTRRREGKAASSSA